MSEAIATAELCPDTVTHALIDERGLIVVAGDIAVCTDALETFDQGTVTLVRLARFTAPIVLRHEI